MIPEKREANEVNPKIAPAYCLPNGNFQAATKGGKNQRESSCFIELWGQRQEFGKTKVAYVCVAETQRTAQRESYRDLKRDSLESLANFESVRQKKPPGAWERK